MDEFDEYRRQDEPEKYEKAENWKIAIGLQDVDGIKPSKYLVDLAKKNIEGDITIEEVKNMISSYYDEKPSENERGDEADKVSAHIAEVLGEKTFTFSPAEFIEIHRRLFEGVLSHAGVIRDYNITKKEWVLDGKTVLYASHNVIRKALDYDFDKERNFDYKNIPLSKIVDHVVEFTIGIWQIHPFGEGNTRTTAVFIIKYLRSLGFKDVSNNLFANNSWYFRNALVRAASTNVLEGVFTDRVYLDRFFRNLLLGETNILKNRDLHINASKNATVNKENATVNKENATVKLSSTQKKILQLLGINSKLTTKDLATEVGVDISTIKRAVKGLKEKNLLERIGSDKTGAWKVIK